MAPSFHEPGYLFLERSTKLDSVCRIKLKKFLFAQINNWNRVAGGDLIVCTYKILSRRFPRASEETFHSTKFRCEGFYRLVPSIHEEFM